MKKLIFLTFALCMMNASLLFAQKQSFSMDQIFPIEASHSYVGFSATYMGYAKVKGRFVDFQGSIRYDEQHPELTSVSFLIKTESIDTDNDWRDRDLKSKNWFDAESFPAITFVSKAVKLTKDYGLMVSGDLTIKETTKEVEIKMDKPSGVLKDTRGDAQVIFTGKLSLDRTEYGVAGENWSAVKEGLTAVGNEIEIELSILGKQIKADNFKNWVRNPQRPPGKVYQLATTEGIDQAITAFETMLAQADEKQKQAAPSVLNTVGYMFLKEGKTKEAIQFFQKNAELFPDNGNVYDSLGEAYAQSGKFNKAKEYFQLALEKDEQNMNAREVLRHLE